MTGNTSMNKLLNHDSLLLFLNNLNNPNLQIWDDVGTFKGKIQLYHVTVWNKIANDTIHFYFNPDGSPCWRDELLEGNSFFYGKG